MNTALFKMIVTESTPSSLVYTIMLLIHLSYATITLNSSSTEVNTSDSVLFNCYVSDLSDAVVFYRETIEIGRCANPIIFGLPGLCVSGFNQDITTNITTYSLQSANATMDEGTWTCQHAQTTSNGISLTVYGFPFNPIDDNQAYLPNIINETYMGCTQLVVNISECVNPAPTINWTIYQDCVGTSIQPISIKSTISNDHNISCSAPYSAYKSFVKVEDMATEVGPDDYCYKIRSIVDYPGTSFRAVIVAFSSNITFTSSAKANCPKGTSVRIWIAILIPCSVFWVVLVITCCCCLFNRRCRFRYLRKNSKWLFTFPPKDIILIENHDETVSRQVGQSIEIQFHNRKKGSFVCKYSNGERNEEPWKTPGILFNPYIVIKNLQKKHEGEYTYKSELNDGRKCCLNLKVEEVSFGKVKIKNQGKERNVVINQDIRKTPGSKYAPDTNTHINAAFDSTD